MKNLMVFITTTAIALLFSMTLNAQTNVPSAIKDNKVKKNIVTYDLTKTYNYAPVNIGYQRVISKRTAITTSIGFFDLSKNDNIKTGTTIEERNGYSGSLFFAALDLLSGANRDKLKAFKKEHNQKGYFLNLGVRFYSRNSRSNSFYFEPEISMYNYKTDLQTATVNKFSNEDGRFLQQTILVKNVKRNYTMTKLNFGYQFMSNNGLTFDLSTGIGGTNESNWASTKQFGPTAVSGSFVFDTELKVGFAF